MPLILSITSYHKLTPGQVAEKSLASGSLCIGRAPDNDWVLPDPERLVSGRHCQIHQAQGEYFVTDTSTNGTFFARSGQRLARGAAERLVDGEVLRLGEYEIQVRIAVDAQGLPLAADPFADFDALMAAPAAMPLGGASAPPMGMSPAVPFQEPAEAAVLPARSDLFDFLEPAGTPPPTQADHLPAQQHDFRPPEPVAKPVSAVPMSSGGSPVIPADWDPFADPMGTPPNQVTHPLSAAPPAEMPRARVEAPATPLPAPASVGAAANAASLSCGAALEAFLRGAGLENLRVDAGDEQALMEALGRGYRHMVEGLVDVLRARASLKSEFRMSQTLIRPVENNPLKFAPNVEEAMLLLLRRSSQAFMAPDEAIRDSFDDVKAHQLAVMAGVQAALKHLLKRFEPGVLEARLGQQSMLANLLPGARQARYWEVFTQEYGAIQREAEDDFQELFGREFSRAYEEQSARMKGR
ncbi:MAG: type VI secretion system-associated FHA domain protein TagH [Gammaproteobacteria bacterium]|nr:type VI secretion system-associated FHA domain protein TagH [Gammaproteobacteria bacterium]